MEQGGEGVFSSVLLFDSTITATLKALNCCKHKRRVHVSQRRPGSAYLLLYRAQLSRIQHHLLAEGHAHT